MCKKIAEAGKGIYVRADNTNNAYRLVNKELDTLAKSDIKTSVFSDYNEQFQSFAMLALLLLVLDFFVFDRINKRLSRYKIFDLKDKVIKNK
jgi:Ca-activated chloride channel family protein